MFYSAKKRFNYVISYFIYIFVILKINVLCGRKKVIWLYWQK